MSAAELRGCSEVDVDGCPNRNEDGDREDCPLCAAWMAAEMERYSWMAGKARAAGLTSDSEYASAMQDAGRGRQL